MKRLHVTNGDSTTRILLAEKIEGDIATCREVLAEGPTQYEIGKASFFEARAAFIEEEFGYEAQGYMEKVRPEFDRMANANAYNEVVLWFEYDLFCQINLCAVLSYLHQLRITTKISLICVGKEQDYKKMVGLGELPAACFPHLFDNRKELAAEDISYADLVWKTYCSDDHTQLEKHTLSNHEPFVYLGDALKAHLTRFPSYKDGLNSIEKKILTQLKKSPKSEHELIGDMLQWQEWFGFGDLQYQFYIKSLAPCYTIEDEVLHLNTEGKALLKQTATFTPQKLVKLGGTLRTEYLYHSTTDKLEKLVLSHNDS